MAACIFCKIIKGTSNLSCYSIHSDRPNPGDISSLKLFESERVYAFLDIQPLSQGHAVCLPFEILPLAESTRD